MPADLPTCPSLSPPPSLYPDKKFPAVEAHFWFKKTLLLYRFNVYSPISKNDK